MKTHNPKNKAGKNIMRRHINLLVLLVLLLLLLPILFLFLFVLLLLLLCKMKRFIPQVSLPLGWMHYNVLKLFIRGSISIKGFPYPLVGCTTMS